jgi:hypothetical protein
MVLNLKITIFIIRNEKKAYIQIIYSYCEINVFEQNNGRDIPVKNNVSSEG